MRLLKIDPEILKLANAEDKSSGRQLSWDENGYSPESGRGSSIADVSVSSTVLNQCDYIENIK